MRDTELAELSAYRDVLGGFPGATRTAGDALATRLLDGPREANRILGLERLGQLDELEPFFEDGSFLVSLDPALGLEPALLERGYVHDYPWQKFTRVPAPLAHSTELAIENPRRPEDFAAVLVRAYGMPESFVPGLAAVVELPGWHCFVAYAGEAAAGAGALHTVGEVGWLGFGATVPEQRGRGAQSAVLAARITRAHELGLRLLVTETGVPREDAPGPSYRNLLRAGFEPVYVRPNLARTR